MAKQYLQFIHMHNYETLVLVFLYIRKSWTCWWINFSKQMLITAKKHWLSISDPSFAVKLGTYSRNDLLIFGYNYFDHQSMISLTLKFESHETIHSSVMNCKQVCYWSIYIHTCVLAINDIQKYGIYTYIYCQLQP